jgi:hypothetical protein
MKKKRLKIKNILILILIVAIGIMLLVKEINYRNSYEYKLKEVGYSETEITTLLKELDDSKINKILDMEYSKYITKLIVEKYFIFNNLNRYLDYYKKYSNETPRNIIEKVNTYRDNDYYTNIKNSDTTKGNLILVPSDYYLQLLVINIYISNN